MKRKMTLLALAAWCGGLGASGLRNRSGISAAHARPAKKPSPKSPVSATAPKPPPISQRNSRRVRRQNGPEERLLMSLVQVKEFIRAQGQQAVAPERLRPIAVACCLCILEERDILL